MNQLWEAAAFVKKLRVRLRFGELSRARLHLLRFELSEDGATCEWIARSPDPWDADVSAEVRENNETSQTLKDTLKVRELLFSIFSEIQVAHLRVYRGRDRPQLVITGMVARGDQPSAGVVSIVMRAKLLGLQFSLDDRVLRALQPQGKQQKENFEFAT